jgi:chitodextrinase
MTYTRNISIAAIIAVSVRADIKVNGLWTNEDWYNHQHKVGVANGVPYSDDTATDRAITSPKALDGPVTDYLDKANVQKVQNILSEDQWDYLFPMRNEVYTYDGFLNAVGKFPKFCMENNDTDNWSGINMCKKELATMFAHFALETSYNSQWEVDNNTMTPLWRQGLHFIENVDCTGGDLGNEGCDYKDYGWSDDYWPNQATQ